MLKALLSTTLILLAGLTPPAQSLENIGIEECLKKHPRIRSTLLSAFIDKNPKPNHPKAYYQIGVVVKNGDHPDASEYHITYLVVKKQTGECQALRIHPVLGYEMYVPGQAAVMMEVKDYKWEIPNFPPPPPGTEIIDVDPAEFGHGCEPVTISQAQAMKKVNHEFECPVRKQRLRLIWDR